MISKLRFSLIAVIMLVLLGFGFQNQARGQVGLDGLFCPAVPDTTGWLMTELSPSAVPGFAAPDFTGGLLGTVENSGPDAVGGLDWQHVDFTSFDTPTPTNEAGSQLVSWWTQKNGRNTYLQVTNADAAPITVHVRIHNEACLEVRDFCDTYTGFDTHEYNFGDLVSNGGAPIADGNLQGVEGWLVVTAVENCGGANENALEHNALAGQLIVHDSDDYLYGVNTYARQGVCFNQDEIIPVNRIANGSFQDGAVSWIQQEPFATVIAAGGFNPPVNPVPANPENSNNLAIVVANNDGAASGTSYTGGSTTNLMNTDLLNLMNDDENVAIWESAQFTVEAGDSNTLSYNLQFLSSEVDFCANWAAVALIQVDAIGDGTIIDATCYQENDLGITQGSIDSDFGGSKNCTLLSTPNAASFGAFGFFASSFQLGQTLNRDGNVGTFIVQVIAGQNTVDDMDCNSSENEAGALVNNFQLNGTTTNTITCDGTLDGSFNAFLDPITPNVLSGQFNLLPGNAQAGADAVVINFADSYGPPYRPVAAFSSLFVSIFDENEVDQSCGDAFVCFTRLGIDDALVMSEDFSPATPTAPPTTAPPTLTPTTPPPVTPTAPPTGNNNNGGSCAIAGSPVQLGTALANVLIPLVPVAFAFGVRAVRRRKK